jgi:hypothetical protein
VRKHADSKLIKSHSKLNKLDEWGSPFADRAKTGAIAEKQQKVQKRLASIFVASTNSATRQEIKCPREHSFSGDDDMWHGNRKTKYCFAYSSMYPFDLNHDSRLSIPMSSDVAHDCASSWSNTG